MTIAFLILRRCAAKFRLRVGKRRNRSPESDAELARCIFDSLALLYADVLHELAQLRGEDFSQLYIVGGGCQNTLLDRLCADACGIRVIAGPVEATLGNIGIQLMTLDELNNVDDFRQVVSTTANLTPYP